MEYKSDSDINYQLYNWVLECVPRNGRPVLTRPGRNCLVQWALCFYETSKVVDAACNCLHNYWLSAIFILVPERPNRL